MTALRTGLLFMTSMMAAVSTQAGPEAAPAQAADLSRGALVLTFDDTFTGSWLAAAPIFSQHMAKVTFFVTRPDQLNERQVEDLRQLRAMGHAIGCHGFRHQNAVEGSRKHGVEAYLNGDIEPAVEALTRLGFTPTAFAYPSSARNEETDKGLLTVFRHLRSGIGTAPGQELKDLDEIFVPAAMVAGTGLLLGVGIDYLNLKEKRPIGQVFAALDRARERGEVVVLYAHNISANGPGHCIRPEVLDRVLAHAQSIGLQAITYDDLPSAASGLPQAEDAASGTVK